MKFWKWLDINCSLYRANKALYTKCQSWPWLLTLWPKINRSFSPYHSQPICEGWKWFDKNCSLYCVHKVLYTECQSWSLPLTPWPKINRVPPLIIHNLHVKFESDWAKIDKVLCTECQSWPWPLTPWPKINRVPPLNLHVKFESDWAKTIVCIVPTRSYTQSDKVDLNLWPRDPKSIGPLLSSSITYMWSLKVIWQQEAQRATYRAPEYNVPPFWGIGQGGHFCSLISPKNTNLVSDVEILLPIKFPWIPFSGFRGEVENVSANQRPGQQSCFSIGPKNTNLVEDLEILLHVKFRWIPLSGFRGEVENVSANQRPSCFSDRPEKAQTW